MVRRRNLLALLGIGVSALVFSAQGYAATGRTFSPVTSWAVNRIDPTNGGAPYCTLARRFDGNTVITFARNTSGEGTVAVDFQQPLFDPNQTYRIALQAGNGLRREFLTRPATPNALVLRTGADSQFFSALGNSSEMGVILDDTRYAFSIPDFGDGTGQLSGCIGQTPAGAAPSMARAPAADSDALNELRAQLNNLKQENAGIVAALKQQGGTSASASDALPATAENRELTEKLAALETEKSALVDRLQSERSRQQQEAQDEQTLKQALEDQKALKGLLENERQQRAALEASLTEKTADAEKRGELRARISSLESSNAELKTLRETLETERSKRLEVEKMLQAQKAASAASLEDQERLRTRVVELETQNKTLQQNAGQLDDMKSQLEDTGARASMEQARRVAAEKALQEMQMSSSEREARIAEMQRQLQTERSKMAEAEVAKEAELTKTHSDEIARLNVEMAKLRDQETRAQEAQQKAMTEQARREAVEKQLQQIQASNSESAARMSQLQQQLETERARIAAAETEKARRETAERELAQIQASNSDANTKLAQMQAQLEAERSKMAAAEAAKETDLARRHADEIARLNADMEKKYNEQIGQMSAEMEKLRTASVAGQDLQQKASIEQARREATERELQQVRADLSAKDTALSKLSAEKADLMGQVESERANAAKARVAADDTTKVKAISDQLAGLEARNSTLMEQLQTAKAQSEAAEKAAVTTSANDAATNEKIVEIGRQAEMDRRELQSLLQAEKARREKLEAIMAKGGSDEDRMAEMTRQMAALQTHNGELEKRLAAEKVAPVADNTAEMAALKKQLDMLKSDNVMLADKLSAAAKLAATTPAAGATEAQVVYAGDDAMASALAESKSTLASVLAERDEYRNLLQRERMNEKDGKAGKPAAEADAGTNARIAALESERAELVRKLEYERSRNEQIASGNEAPPPSTGASESQINERLAAVMAEKDALKKQLAMAQQDVIDARRTASAPTVAPVVDTAAEAEIDALKQQLELAQREAAQNKAAGKGDTAKADQTVAQLKRQLEVAQQDVIAARRQAAAKPAAVNTTPASDVSALLDENRKLQAELAASANNAGRADMRSMEAEVAALRAQNNVMSQEINKRLAAAPTRAAMDNASAEADFKVRQATQQAQAAAAADLAKVNNRFSAAEAENIRLAKELAQSRAAAQSQAQAQAQIAQAQAQAAAQQQAIQQAAQKAVAEQLAAQQQQMTAGRVVAPIVSQDQMVAAPAVPVVMATAAPQVTPVVYAQPKAPAQPMFTQASISPNAVADSGPSGQDISGFLKRAGIPMVSGFEKVRKASSPNFAAFRWDTGVVFGTAEQIPMKNGEGFEQAVNAYIQKTRQRCSGTFDQSFDENQVKGTRNFAVADVACVMPDGTGAGAAMLFFYKDGMFNAIAHEGDISQFDQAMSTRDNLAKFMKSVL